MPRLSTIGSAATGAYGFSLSGIPALISAQYVVVGAAGARNGYGGGGGGYVNELSASLSTKTDYSIVISSGSGRGSSTTFNGTTSLGGFDGSPGSNPGGGGQSANGNFGGLGNGGSFPVTVGWPTGGDGYGGGGGAGAGAGGGNGYVQISPDYRSVGGDGGAGVAWSVDGNYFGGGSGGGAYAYNYTYGPAPGIEYFGAPGNGHTSFGGDGRGGAVISYVYPIQLYTGGSISSTGSGLTKRWFHSFSSGSPTTLTLTHIY